MQNKDNYLKPTSTIDCDSESIKQKAQDLIKGRETVVDKVQGLFYFVRDTVKYKHFGPVDVSEYFRASRTLERREGNCIQKAVLLVALCRVVGIPARLRFADFRNYRMADNLLQLFGSNLAIYHGYNELFIEGQWVMATPTFDLETCENQRYIPVEFDGKNDAKLPIYDLDGNKFIEYVKEHGHYEDLPWDEIIGAWVQVYGREWKRIFES